MGGRTGYTPAYLLAAAFALSCASSASATTPSLLWANAKRVAVSCLVQSRLGVNASSFEDVLCERVLAAARETSSLPVDRARMGDPAFVASDTVMLLVHASVARASQGKTVAFTIRPYRPSGGEAEVYFGAAPRALEMKTLAASKALDIEVHAALSEILPERGQ